MELTGRILASVYLLPRLPDWGYRPGRLLVVLPPIPDRMDLDIQGVRVRVAIPKAEG